MCKSVDFLRADHYRECARVVCGIAFLQLDSDWRLWYSKFQSWRVPFFLFTCCSSPLELLSCYLKVCDYISEVRGSANASCSHENQCFIFSPICAQSLTWPYLTLPWMYLCIALCVPACIPQCAEICASWRSTTVPFCTVLWSPQHKYCPCCASCERCCCCYSYTVFFIDLVVWNISRCLHKGSSVCIVLPG